MNLVGTRNRDDTASFMAAAAGEVPAHGGLFALESLPRWNDVDALLELPWNRRCVEILQRLVGDELERATLAAIVAGALDFDVPVVRVPDGTLVLELFHGPTLAFKDFGARFLAALLERLPAGGPRTILTATSGDTGAAVAHAFWNRRGVRVVVLYPRGRVSPLQERQIASLGGNVSTFAVEGTFDDCQALVKACFADRRLSGAYGLTSANSINIARLLAQVLYYFEGVARARALGVRGELVISVPSGNFGNLCAALMAWRLGLPARAHCAATNVNDTIPRYLETGAYEPRATIATLSNAMDVAAPSNWERIEALFGGHIDLLRAQVRCARVDETETAAEIRRLAATGYVACPHTAVGSAALERVLQPGERGLFVATAHPAKFASVLEPILGRPVPLPERLARLAGAPVLSRTIGTDRDAFVSALHAVLQRAP